MKFLRKPFRWAIVLVAVLAVATGYTMLDTFVIPKTYASATAASAPDTNKTLPPIVTDTTVGIVPQSAVTSAGSAVSETTSDTTAAAPDYSYEDAHMRIRIDVVRENGVVYYAADIQLADVSFLQTAFAKDQFGKNITEVPSGMAADHNAILAVNGDYCGFRNTGLVIRNGELYRDNPRSAPENQSLLIDKNGDFSVITEGSVSGQDLVDQGITQSFSFGPALVTDGQPCASLPTSVGPKNPRTAIGQLGPLHYLMVVVDGRTPTSKGMTLKELQKAFTDRGAICAYNLDGGGSAVMVFNGSVISVPTDGSYMGERRVSDIIYIPKP